MHTDLQGIVLICQHLTASYVNMPDEMDPPESLHTAQPTDYLSHLDQVTSYPLLWLTTSKSWSESLSLNF